MEGWKDGWILEQNSKSDETRISGLFSASATTYRRRVCSRNIIDSYNRRQGSGHPADEEFSA